VPSYLGLAIPRYVFGSTNLVGRHGCVTFLRSVCFVSLYQPTLDIPESYVGIEGLPMGCTPNGPAKYLHVTSLMFNCANVIT
jgi:hypothetical protein